MLAANITGLSPASVQLNMLIPRKRKMCEKKDRKTKTERQKEKINRSHRITNILLSLTCDLAGQQRTLNTLSAPQCECYATSLAC